MSESELAYIRADAQTGWQSRSSGSLEELEKEADLDRQIGDLLQAEEDVAAAYNPDEVASLIGQFYQCMVTMGHWPEGSVRYPPHTNPPVNEELALQLGYTPAAVSLMHRLPYPSSNINGWNNDLYAIFSCTRIADYTSEDHIREGRRPYPYEYLDGCPDLDPWLLPLVLPKLYGWHVMLDTNLGVIRAYGDYVPTGTVEWRRHSEGPEDDDHEGWKQAELTEYRRAALVPAAHYFSELIYAYRSLSRLPVIDATNNDPNEDQSGQTREEQQTLLKLYREFGWPHEWRRAEFVAKWAEEKEKISERWRCIRAAESRTAAQ
ncbi:hypothetical protein B0H12DRAFT_1123471 [Mycena haematopus]|nr:hypothetical protein B0H12DRAFT_1123471 [Mycena haematopus]